ncbi:MAG: helix-turn-helix domain-containing protein [Synechococcus sp. SB0677_bin_5]|nr:helix-turn-helix domain-containing protein [Synechococcus sp. SB0677_bin_5]
MAPPMMASGWTRRPTRHCSHHPATHSTHWSVRTLAQHTGIPKSTAHRRLQASNLQPRRHRHCNTSNHPQLGGYGASHSGSCPVSTVVLCVDGKGQLQALERPQPMLPLEPGSMEGVTHDHSRIGRQPCCCPGWRHGQRAGAVQGLAPPPRVFLLPATE